MNRPLLRSHAEVASACRAYLAQEGLVQSWRVCQGVAAVLGWEYGPERTDPGLPFEGQVKRAMAALTAAEECIKVGRGQQHPDGSYENQAAWYSRSAWETAVRAAETAAEAEAARRAPVGGRRVPGCPRAGS